MRWRLVIPGLAAALVLVSYDAEAQRLERLFSTPEERALLDELRRERKIVAPDPQVTEIVPDTPTVEQVTINGVVLRSGGTSSAWINGRQVDAGARTREGVRVDTSPAGGGRVKITLPSGAETIDLKPGQKIDVDSGVVVEAYERASGAGAYTVFDRVAIEGKDSAETGGGASAPSDARPEKQSAPVGTEGAEYPPALLERIRRALQGN
ncbi:MAG: hypothetical protein R3337_05790 [Gammaproteobacteria bacterium]|nr:hypothetical protein [Gammaproteobacteria bacterium]